MTGAIVLVVLAVLLVPELLTGPRAASTPAAEAPGDPGPPMRSYTIDLTAEAGDGTPAAAMPASLAAPPRSAEPPAASSAAPEAPPAAVAPAPDAPASAATPAMQGATGGGWAVQLGSFSSQANAERLVRELGTKGFDAYIDPTRNRSRQLFRVRVGAAPSRAEVETLRERLRASGYDGAVVAPP